MKNGFWKLHQDRGLGGLGASGAPAKCQKQQTKNLTQQTILMVGTSKCQTPTPPFGHFHDHLTQAPLNWVSMRLPTKPRSSSNGSLCSQREPAIKDWGKNYFQSHFWIRVKHWEKERVTLLSQMQETFPFLSVLIKAYWKIIQNSTKLSKSSHFFMKKTLWD